MLVSVITPCFQPGSELMETIESVQRQTYTNYEHIIIDDGSSSTLDKELLQRIESDPKIRYIKRTWNAGPAVTRNRGISEARGNFIAFLDADDTWHPDKLDLHIKFMLDNDCALSYSSYEVFDTRGKILGRRIPPKELTYTDVLASNQIGCLTAIYSVDKLGKIYMPNIAKRQDMGLWLKILKGGVVAKGYIEKPLARYRVGANSISSNKFSVLKYQWRIYREVEKLPFIKSLKYFSQYTYRGLTRKV